MFWRAVCVAFLNILCLLASVDESDYLDRAAEDDTVLSKPLFIIGGTQKSGTTVLAAYLGQHPNITFSKTKELHFFDKSRLYKTGIGKYLSNFAVYDDTAFIGESTPSYIASRLACQRIYRHFPGVKMVILLREPINRAYSEYQMKHRRIVEQEEFITLVHNQSQLVHDCIVKHPVQYSSIGECLSKSIQEHGRLGKLKKALRRAYEELKNWEHVTQLCFTNYTTTSLENCVIATEDGTCQLSQISRAVFHPERCWSYYRDGFERLANLSHAFITEIEDFQQCANLSYRSGSTCRG
jgi:hypothetical protein